MPQIVQIQLTGKSLGTLVLLVFFALCVLALVWLTAGPAYAIAGGLITVLLVRGALALLRAG